MTRILVAGAAGEVGRAVVSSLLDRAAEVRVLVHSTPVDGGERVRGDLGDPGSIARALIDCEAACFITPHHADEERLGRNFVDACEAARLRRLVYVSAYHPLSRSRVVQRLLDTLIGFVGPHYRAKLRVERRVRGTTLSPVALCPTNFYQNDELALPEILAGLYPNPMGDKAVSRVDTRDIGDAAARALLDDVEEGAYPVVGPQPWTSDQTAAAWSEALGTPVSYAGDDIERWRRSVGARMPAAKATDFAKTYRVIQRFGIPASARAIARTTALLGRPPRDFKSYVREQVERLQHARAS
ncbi:MAG: NAD(P)H-binding protein [Kofleriaceae bacterium]|nr:MAG: NAD(P)H-binding protein [Kofleriaceae bacterium]MBZ0233380.1 NAD(P)H-binding protein [Kofleriaceae bacterium]